jgi:hypothetical protein
MGGFGHPMASQGGAHPSSFLFFFYNFIIIFN